MKISSVVWIALIVMAGYVGFAVGTDHNRPRVKGNRYIVHQILKEPKDVAGFRPTDDNWETIRTRFEAYESSNNEDERFFKEEKWRSWTSGTEVKVIYNTTNDEVWIVCDKERCKE